ncbi:hypothetical protein B0H12DRAFT_708466 [Mycena haematopus]|nr:hypothetical protein B0H12DRAFT_708466 [Mycena haematopus]
MRALSALPLDDDIVDRIFTFCPTFGTLQSLMLVSKAFYSIYQTHPKSVTRSVAYNIVGPALPQALRVLRYPYDAPDGGGPGGRQRDDPDTLATDCPEEHSPSVITATEKEQLQEDSTVITALEDVYSVTQKDRTSRTSVLTADESWRFRRAAYRIMLYCNLFPATDSDELDDDGIKHVQRQRTAVLQEYPTDELLQLYAVVRFFRDILEEVCDGELNPSNMVNVLLAMGPNGLKRAWDDRSYGGIAEDLAFDWEEGDEFPLFAGYFSLPLDNIWTARKVKPPNDEEPATRFILDTIIGANDTCSQCASPGGLALFTQANWHRAVLNPIELLRGRLKQNSTLWTPLTAAVHAHLKDNPDHARHHWDDYADNGPWIASVFDVSKTSEWNGWTKDQSYCLPCLTKFLEEHVWRWFLEERINVCIGGWSPPENCWYGYNCRTMVHNQTHADKKNHLCVPTRGDL